MSKEHTNRFAFTESQFKIPQKNTIMYQSHFINGREYGPLYGPFLLWPPYSVLI